MNTQEKDHITTQYCEWWNKRAAEPGYGAPGDPYRKAAFLLWLHYNLPTHESDCNELHEHLVKTTELLKIK